MELTAAEIRGILLRKDSRGLSARFEELHPRQVAEALATLEPQEIVQVLRLLPKDEAIEIFEFFSEETQIAIFEGFARREMADFLEEMSSDDRADLVKRLNPDLADSVLALMAQVDREDIRRLTAYHEGTAGAIMTTDYAFLSADITVAEALEQLRIQAPSRETINYIYVVDADRRLRGVVHLKDLIVARPAATKKVSDVMRTEVIKVRINDDPLDVARTISKYDLIAVPVIDASERLVGIVTVDDAMDLLDPDAQEPSTTGEGPAAASDLGYVDRVAWALKRSRGVALLIPAFIIVVAWMMLARNESHVAMTMAAIGLPLMVALGVTPGARCNASTARSLVRERGLFGSFAANLGRELLLALPVAAGVVAAMALLTLLRAGEPAPYEPRLLWTMAAASAAQIIGAAFLGGLTAILTRSLRLPAERIVAPSIVALPDALGIFIYFALIDPAIKPFVA